MELNNCINFLLTKAQQSVFRYFKAKLAEYDITPVQYGILSCLWKEDGQTPKQLAANLCLDGSTVTGILDRMENKRLVHRTPDANDRRALRVVLTKKSLELKETLQKVIEEANDEIMGVFSEGEKILLKEFLQRFDHH